MSGAIFGEDDGHVEFYHLNAYERFSALQSGQVDMLARITTYTMERDVYEVRTPHDCVFRLRKACPIRILKPSVLTFENILFPLPCI